jgi:hypothetical protein
VIARAVRTGLDLRLGQVQEGLRVLLDGDTLSIRRVALAVLLVQAAGCVAAWLTNVMLHGDGAYFIYALSVDGAWTLKWRDIAARAAVFVTTVLPTEIAALSLQLSPMQISALNGFIFYLVPLLQFAVACALVWRSHPQYLIFPAAQYALSMAMAYGFPSEILLAPGFLWICLFLVLKGRASSLLFALSFAGLVFSHELALPAAFVAAFLALRSAREADQLSSSPGWRMPAWAAFFLGVFALLIWTRLNGGGAGSDANAVFVMDPRRVGNNPTLWLVIGASVAAAIAIHRFPSLSRRGLGIGAIVLAAFAIPLLLRFLVPTIDFEQGRYDSARSIIGGVMFVLALCFASILRAAPERFPSTAQGWRGRAPFVVAVALAISVGSGIAFLYDWSLALRGLERAIVPISTAGSINFVPYAEARALMHPDEAMVNDRIDFHWALPYRAMVLANGGLPSRVPFIEENYRPYCDLSEGIEPARSAIPEPALAAMRQFSCTQTPPPPLDTMSRKFFRYFAEWRRSIFGEQQPDPMTGSTPRPPQR